MVQLHSTVIWNAQQNMFSINDLRPSFGIFRTPLRDTFAEHLGA
jgi:hypothetical protein